MVRTLILAGVALAATAAPAHANPRMLSNRDGALSGPSGASRTAIARGFLRGRGFGTSELAAPAVQQTPRGVTIVSFRETYKGIPTDHEARVVIDRAGRVIELLGQPQDLSLPDRHAEAERGGRGRRRAPE